MVSERIKPTNKPEKFKFTHPYKKLSFETICFNNQTYTYKCHLLHNNY